MNGPAAQCPACGTPGTGKFCSRCGVPREGSACVHCATPLSSGARFCSRCGAPTQAAWAVSKNDRLPWIIAGVALAGMLALALVVLARDSKRPSAAEEVASEQPQEAPPDISGMSPRERFNRLYNRIMRAAQSGDEASVTRFTPMALMAYAQLDTLDADARYHAALLKVHTGDLDAARALSDTILAQTPGHLFGYVIRGTVARFRKDDKELNRAYAEFLKRYDKELKLKRAEYAEHQRALDDFRRAALESNKKSS